MLASILVVVGVVLGILGAMLGCVELGYRVGRRLARRDANHEPAAMSVVEGAVFGLLGLLLAFSFAGAAGRFDTRRALAVEEANDIGTAWLRLDLLRPDDQPALRDLFRSYVDARIAMYQRMPDVEGALEELAKAQALQARIWSLATQGCRRTGGSEAALLLLPALNAMIDITTTRTRAALSHMPAPIYTALFVVALLASVLVGHAMSAGEKRNVLHGLLFAAAVTLTMSVILDFEFPRLGLIRLDSSDAVLVELRDSLR